MNVKEAHSSYRLNSHLSLAMAGVALLPGIALANPFQNGGFETGLNPPTASYRSLLAGNTDIDGWTVESDRIDWSGTPWHPKEGQLSAQLVGDGSSISQTFDSVAGESYQISFSIQSALVVVTPVTISLSFDASTYDVELPVGPSYVWHDYSTTLPASSASSTLRFTSIDGGHVGPFLDDVKVTAVGAAGVPELCATLPLLGLGLIALGGARRRFALA